MKNLMRSAAAAAFALFLISNNVSASPRVEPKAECKNNSCEKFKIGMYRVRNTVSMNLLMEKQKGERVAIRLMDSKGKVLHEEFVPKYLSKYGRKLNFQEIKDGVYTLEVSNDYEKIVKSIYLATNEVREVERTLVGVN
ncbi:hypothetical protein MUK70_27640 [Dyadobacter chenwenxiniae]|uniref:Por secretion system C-terminal sorting domain-containing protein n=2 Tax=Dyadobacter chenwenxiniae TaxID=2906456 RepID=A0A9X1PPI2_9BACT|nr:hypothetical protein [Dyadobacter chenwenxiniae]MCF0064054.1 hypothetical protein [Dyadobacter chenwenxiniae]UON82782.1 hypothetical protein MUK70_27640 [Dyadobacter chenwenxiniae]